VITTNNKSIIIRIKSIIVLSSLSGGETLSRYLKESISVNAIIIIIIIVVYYCTIDENKDGWKKEKLGKI
jgi:hypothetical protein